MLLTVTVKSNSAPLKTKLQRLLSIHRLVTVFSSLFNVHPAHYIAIV